MNILLSLSESTILHAITGKLHKLLHESLGDSRLPRDHRIAKAEMKWNYGSHPRRYLTSTNRSLIKRFIGTLRRRLESIPENKTNEPLNWSVSYTGWTQSEGRRVYEHSRHNTGSTIAYLLEAAMWNKYPTKRYLLRSLTIANVTDVRSIRFAEHVISILTNSYFSSAGLCGAIGGDKASESRAQRTCTEETWDNGTRALIKQKVYEVNKSNLEKGSQRFCSLYEKI
ncbi:hypothetical protein OCU04_011089 [Sclerotinia nivalis]|uniref:Uncharacterized protein n=1 Tax=Sclerotinia nivalis TaxID=352851 RepID=A0A9X0AEM9_9HELO|nr:hypothetical protein OCU04_011089 [Sclerotinia nivalis]